MDTDFLPGPQDTSGLKFGPQHRGKGVVFIPGWRNRQHLVYPPTIIGYSEEVPHGGGEVFSLVLMDPAHAVQSRQAIPSQSDGHETDGVAVLGHRLPSDFGQLDPMKG